MAFGFYAQPSFVTSPGVMVGWVASLVLATNSTVSYHQFGYVLGHATRWNHVGGGRFSLYRSCSSCHGGIGSLFGAIADSAPG